MNCELNNLLGRYHDGELSAGDRLRFEQHLGDCPPCARELEQMRGISQVLRAGTVPRASAEFIKRLESLASNVEDVTVIRFVRRLTAAAAAVLLFATLQWATVNHAPAPQPVADIKKLPQDEAMLIDPESAASNALPDNNLTVASGFDPFAADSSGGNP
jgi:anti-sigma factor RsiW